MDQNRWKGHKTIIANHFFCVTRNMYQPPWSEKYYTVDATRKSEIDTLIIPPLLLKLQSTRVADELGSLLTGPCNGDYKSHGKTEEEFRAPPAAASAEALSCNSSSVNIWQMYFKNGRTPPKSASLRIIVNKANYATDAKLVVANLSLIYCWRETSWMSLSYYVIMRDYTFLRRNIHIILRKLPIMSGNHCYSYQIVESCVDSSSLCLKTLQ